MQVFGFLNEEASSMTLKVKEISWLGFDFDKTKNKKKENKGFLYYLLIRFLYISCKESQRYKNVFNY